MNYQIIRGEEAAELKSPELNRYVVKGTEAGVGITSICQVCCCRRQKLLKPSIFWVVHNPAIEHGSCPLFLAVGMLSTSFHRKIPHSPIYDISLLPRSKLKSAEGETLTMLFCFSKQQKQLSGNALILVTPSNSDHL